MFPGSPCRSPGGETPETTPSGLMVGYFSTNSAGNRSSTSTPKARAMEAPRSSSSCRATVRATDTDPVRRRPVATPVSSSSLA